MIFASLNQLDFKVTSRRDDLLSLCYFLIYLFNAGKLPGINMNSKLDRNESFKQARSAKQAYKLSDICSGRTKSLEPFFREVFQLRFAADPNYD